MYVVILILFIHEVVLVITIQRKRTDFTFSVTLIQY